MLHLTEIKRKKAAATGAIMLAVAALLGPTTPLAAETWAAGAGVSQGPVLTLQHQPSRDHGWHGTVGYKPGIVSMQIDHQRFWWPRFGRFAAAKVGVYSGLGLAGRSAPANAKANGREIYHGRIPLGFQAELRKLQLQLFVEGALTVGPIPRTDVATMTGAGVRASF